MPKQAKPRGPEDLEALMPENQLCFALYSASLAMSKAYKPLLEPLNLTYLQYLVMLALWSGGTSNLSQIAKRLALDSPTLTPVLKRLEAAGYVQRTRDPADDRKIVLALTDAGVQLKAQVKTIQAGIASASSCTLEEAQDLTGKLRELRAQLALDQEAA
ncbi:MarR family winged helix-turn-helix transcriptional regulator [Burkholderiaceae bacterium UC74_6]